MVQGWVFFVLGFGVFFFLFFFWSVEYIAQYLKQNMNFFISKWIKAIILRLSKPHLGQDKRLSGRTRSFNWGYSTQAVVEAQPAYHFVGPRNAVYFPWVYPCFDR